MRGERGKVSLKGLTQAEGTTGTLGQWLNSRVQPPGWVLAGLAVPLVEGVAAGPGWGVPRGWPRWHPLAPHAAAVHPETTPGKPNHRGRGRGLKAMVDMMDGRLQKEARSETSGATPESRSATSGSLYSRRARSASMTPRCLNCTRVPMRWDAKTDRVWCKGFPSCAQLSPGAEHSARADGRKVIVQIGRG